MKLKNRQDDASAPELNEWLKMYDWFAELRDDDPAGPADHGLAEPADDSAPRPETVATPAASWPAASRRGQRRYRGQCPRRYA